MKKLLLSTILILTVLSSNAITDKIRLGFVASPGISWWQSLGNNVKQGTVRYGMNYGVIMDYYFKDQNYGIQTGLFGGLENGELKNRDVFTANTGSSVRERYLNQYLAIPLYLKLKSNSMKGFHIFGQVGFTLVGTVSSRATYNTPLIDTNGDPVSIANESILTKNNSISSANIIPNFRTNYFDFRLSVGAGFEYEMTEDVSLLFGAFYHNGFINILADRDAKSNPILSRNLLFSVGVMF